jgi:hypothetical protein
MEDHIETPNWPPASRVLFARRAARSKAPGRAIHGWTPTSLDQYSDLLGELIVPIHDIFVMAAVAEVGFCSPADFSGASGRY